jgi:hypothetical protein
MKIKIYQKQSNGSKNIKFFGEISYSPNEFFTTKYNFSKKMILMI